MVELPAGRRGVEVGWWNPQDPSKARIAWGLWGGAEWPRGTQQMSRKQGKLPLFFFFFCKVAQNLKTQVNQQLLPKILWKDSWRWGHSPESGKVLFLLGWDGVPRAEVLRGQDRKRKFWLVAPPHWVATQSLDPCLWLGKFWENIDPPSWKKATFEASTTYRASFCNAYIDLHKVFARWNKSDGDRQILKCGIWFSPSFVDISLRCTT